MKLKLAIFAFLTLISIGIAQEIERIDKDKYLFIQKDETSYFNFNMDNGCSYKEFDLYVATTAIVTALRSRERIARYSGVRVVFGYKVGTTDNSGNETLKFTPAFKVEIPKAGLLKINKNYFQGIYDEALFQSRICGGNPLNRVQYPKLAEAVRIMKANGGKVSYNPDHFSYTFTGGLRLR